VARATWFCVDIECGGPVPGLYDLLSLGAVPLRGVPPGLHQGPTFYVEVIPTAPRVDPGAMKVNGLDLDRIRREGAPLRVALERLSAFVAAETERGSKPVFVGHNAPFDWSFVSYAYHACELPNPFGYKALDTKAMSMGVLGLHWFDTNKETLEVLLGLPPQDAALTHRADYDAQYQSLILRELLRRQPRCGDG
jgi:DNA polymerase III epsilon subunit-like protein